MSEGQEISKMLVLPNDVQEVAQLNMFVKDVCSTLNISSEVTTNVILAVEEAVVNAMNYAYPEGTQGEIRIKAYTRSDQLSFEISDDGKPFDPTTTNDPDLTLSTEQRPIGGMGIYLMKLNMDDMKYQRVNGCNILYLTKNLKPTNS